MAKKNRDLFEILGARSGSGSGGLIQRVQDIVKPQNSRGSGKARKSKKGRSAKEVASPGVVLAAVAFCCLLVGFVAGRWTAGGAVDDGGQREQLNANAGAVKRAAARPEEDFGLAPKQFGQVRPLPDEKVVERLSTFGFVLLTFPVPNGQDGNRAAFKDARRVVFWLREQGFSNVRLRRMKQRGQPIWAVVDYVRTADDPDEYARLRALESPAFAPGFAASVQDRNSTYRFKS